MTKQKISRSPRKIRASNKSDEAWIYENMKSIEVYVRREGVDVLSARIPRRLLADWIKRTEPTND